MEGMLMDFKKRPVHQIIIVFVAALIVLCVIITLPKSHAVNCSLNATEINRSDNTQKQLVLTIAGNYRSSFLGKSSFAGRIEIEGIPLTSGELEPVLFDASEKNYGSLTYKNGNSYEFIGYIRMDKRISEIIICLFEPLENGRKVWEENKGIIISYPKADLSAISDLLY